MATLHVPLAVARPKTIACLSVLCLLGLLGAPSLATAQAASPPLPEGRPPHLATAPSARGGITAVVVKSWGDGGASAWQELNDEWPLYGDIPIIIDTTTLGGGDFTFQDLVDTGADVVILSDTAGGVQQYSASEIDAINAYASIGHNVLGTYIAFQWVDIDNRGLAPVFGLRSDLLYNTVEVGISNEFNVIDFGNPLFQGIPDQWTSEGYAATQLPSQDLRWDEPDLAGAEFAAQSDDFKAMISVYDGGAYTGIYVSNMPEYFGGSLDKQLLYNAITYPRPCVGRLTLDKSEVRSGEPLEYAVYLRHNRLDPVTARLSVRIIDSLGATLWERHSKPMSFEYRDEVRLRDSFVMPATLPPGSYLLAVTMDQMQFRRTTTKRFDIVP